MLKLTFLGLLKKLGSNWKENMNLRIYNLGKDYRSDFLHLEPLIISSSAPSFHDKEKQFGSFGT